MAKIGVCLSGCGVNDGAEILFTAPNMIQVKVVNHLTGDEMGDRRNVLVESACIARGNIIDLAELTATNMDALIFPGGFGAALN